VIHYHGLPITPETAAFAAISGGHAFVSYQDARNLSIVIAACQSFAVDNGAFSAWRAGKPVDDWSEFYTWAAGVARHPSCDFIVIPDVIDGTEAENDALLAEFPLGAIGAPVWHLHESLGRLERLVYAYQRVALGSSGEYATVGNTKWWTRINAAMRVACDADGFPHCKLHGLRMLDPDLFSRLPLASADSTNIARNIGIDSAWRGTYAPPTKEARAAVMRARIESVNAPARWSPQPVQESLCLL
jgi:hypothetical protein